MDNEKFWGGVAILLVLAVCVSFFIKLITG